MLLLSADELRDVVDVGVLLTELERGFVALSEGRAQSPPRAGVLAPQGALVVAMVGHVPAAGIAVKLFFGAADDPDFAYLIGLFDEATGKQLALMDGRYLTDVRTAASTAVAVRLLARPDARRLAVIGAGALAGHHLDIVTTVRAFEETRLASRNSARATHVASGYRGVAATGIEEAVRGADVVCLCTDARTPVIDTTWLAPGALVTSICGPLSAEVDPATVARARIFVEWRGAAAEPPPAGARELQGVDPTTVTELGEALAGRRAGRRDDDELILYKSTGHAVEDCVAARLVYDAARRRGVGRELTL